MIFVTTYIRQKHCIQCFFFSFYDRYDEKRVEEVGPNKACAEWLLKCGAQVKFKNWGSYVNDYNKLPPGGKETFKIEEILANNSCISGKGFEYLSRFFEKN